jgi:hypothetical protein
MEYDLDAALANKDDTLYFDSASTGLRPKLTGRRSPPASTSATEKAGGADRARGIDLYRAA